MTRITVTLARRLVAEGIGTAVLLAAVVGAGIIGERLASGSEELASLANTVCAVSGVRRGAPES